MTDKPTPTPSERVREVIRIVLNDWQDNLNSLYLSRQRTKFERELTDEIMRIVTELEQSVNYEYNLSLRKRIEKQLSDNVQLRALLTDVLPRLKAYRNIRHTFRPYKEVPEFDALIAKIEEATK